MDRRVVLSGFADETCHSKNLDQQLSVVAALGMQYFSIRFVECEGGIKNVVNLSPSELARVAAVVHDYGLGVASLGSPIGKVKLLDEEDGTNNPYIPFPKYLDTVVRPACHTARRLDTKLIRGFSFYHPKNTDAREHLPQAIDQIGQIVEVASEFDLVFGLEVETNLVGHSGWLLKEIVEEIDNPHLALIFDGGNLVTQGYSRDEVFEQYRVMKPYLGWLHVKDYLSDAATVVGDYIDEDALSRYVPATQGDSGYRRILGDVAEAGEELFERSTRLGLPGLFLDLEPHLKGGGQFGGVSGPDGFGLAFRELCGILEEVGLAFHLRDLADIKGLAMPSPAH